MLVRGLTEIGEGQAGCEAGRILKVDSYNVILKYLRYPDSNFRGVRR